MAVSVCDIFYFGFQLNGLKGAFTLVKFVGKTVSGFAPRKRLSYLSWQLGFAQLPKVAKASKVGNFCGAKPPTVLLQNFASGNAA